MTKKFFVAGTDTGVGKTLISAALLCAANERGLSTAALKPVAAGCEETPDGLRNDDAVLLQSVINTELSYDQINPVALKTAIAPHVAAEQEQRRITVDRLVGICRGALMKRADFTIIEGAGGWRVPLNSRETLASLPKELATPVILVVGIRLGCLNHALLTAEAILRDGLTVAGWVANRIDPDMEASDESIATLERMIPAPCLGHIPFFHNPRIIDIQSELNIDKLLG